MGESEGIYQEKEVSEMLQIKISGSFTDLAMEMITWGIYSDPEIKFCGLCEPQDFWIFCNPINPITLSLSKCADLN